MRTWLRSKTGLLFMTCALLIAVPGVAWAADAVVSDGDVLTAPITDQDMAAGSVPCNSPTTKKANIALRHSGGGQVFKNGSTVTVTASATGTGLSAQMDSSTITLPSNWEGSVNGTLSPSVSSTVTINPSVAGPGSGSVTYTATGTQSDDSSLTRTD